MKLRQANDLKKINSFFGKVQHNQTQVVYFSFNRGGFLALNLNIHLNLTQRGSCLSLHNVRVRRVLEMVPTQRRVDFPFILINKEEMEMDIEREFVALSEQDTKPLTHQHATSYDMLTWSELREFKISINSFFSLINFHLFI